MITLDQGANNQRIIDYFDKNYTAMRWMWTNGRSLALHFGYWDDATRTDYEAQLNTNRQLATRAGIKSGQSVLDAGCGIGGSAVWLAETYGVSVFGVTLSADQVRHATENAARRGVSHLAKFSQQDYTHMDVKDASFDVVFALESASCAVNKHDFFAEAFRVLKPGGRLVLSDGFRRKRPFADEDEALLKKFLWGWAIPDLVTPDEFVASIKGAGFGEVQFEDVSVQVEPSMRRLYQISRRLLPLIRIFGPLGLIPAAALQSAQGSYDQYTAYRRDLCGYAFLSARKPSA
jgi:tocopherol O-methyltransferase